MGVLYPGEGCQKQVSLEKKNTPECIAEKQVLFFSSY